MKKTRKTRTTRQVGRVATVNAMRSMLDLETGRRALAIAMARPPRTTYSTPSYVPVQDLRRWTPERRPFVTLRTTSGAPARTAVATAPSRRSTRTRSFSLPHVVSFAAPATTLTCVRRHARREVMFARRFAGKGISIYTKPRRNWASSISCRG